MECSAQDCGISKAANDTSMLPKIIQMKASQEAGSEANIGFKRALMPSVVNNSQDGIPQTISWQGPSLTGGCGG